MKKFSRTLTAGLSIAAALTLTACHPPHQQDSDIKVDSGSTFTGVAPAQKEASATATVTPTADGEAGVETQDVQVLDVIETTSTTVNGTELAVATPVATETVVVNH